METAKNMHSLFHKLHFLLPFVNIKLYFILFITMEYLPFFSPMRIINPLPHFRKYGLYLMGRYRPETDDDRRSLQLSIGVIWLCLVLFNFLFFNLVDWLYPCASNECFSLKDFRCHFCHPQEHSSSAFPVSSKSFLSLDDDEW